MHFPIKVYLLMVIFSYVDSDEGRGINGGISCAACTIVFGISDQLAEIHNETLLAASLRLCEMFPTSADSYCKEAVRTLEPIIINMEVSRLFTPDVLCYALGYCHVDKGHGYCHLFPRPVANFRQTVQRVQAVAASTRTSWPVPVHQLAYDLCQLPGMRQLCELLNNTFVNVKPAFDLDKDLFSIVETARGSHWRGRDCADWDPHSYPGRQPHKWDVEADHNCNGIWGKNAATGVPLEEELCAGTGAQGLVLLGDSVSAHFHFPQAWMNPRMISWLTIHNYTGPLLDGLDWPQLGYATGFTNTTEPLLIKGITDSIYLRMRARNRCNHRDYQNLSQNGASSEDLIHYVDSLARNQTVDKPAVVLYSAFGNDVCNSYADTENYMTKPKQFQQNVLHVLKHLNNSLPKGSHVVLLGLVDGGFIFPTMADRFHPLGQLRRDVRYRDVYRWFTCMEIGPCAGWMTPNATLRALATKRSHELSQVLRHLSTSYKFSNLELHYLDNPVAQVFQEWKTLGHALWQLMEPVDSLHPNQLAQPLMADVLWRNILSVLPGVFGDVNPNNDRIQQLFGDQGGH